MFLDEVLQELVRQSEFSGQPNVQEFLGIGVDSSIQPEAPVIDLNYHPVNRKVIRAFVTRQL